MTDERAKANWEKRFGSSINPDDTGGVYYCIGFEDGIAHERKRINCQAQIDRLYKIIAQQLSENDELGAEYTYVAALKKELALERKRSEKLVAPTADLLKWIIEHASWGMIQGFNFCGGSELYAKAQDALKDYREGK